MPCKVIELCLKNGLGLNMPYTYIQEKYFFKTEKHLWFCFEPYQSSMKTEILEGKPAKATFLKSYFERDIDLTNLQLALKNINWVW